jgi:hypothetical protein
MTAFEPKDLISLIQSLAWPITTLVGLFYFRRPLHKLIEELPGRASKISILDFSIELAKVPELATTWSAAGVDIRRLSAAGMFDSNTHDLIQQISSSGAADYAVIDIGDEDQWLTSRLFLISELLERMRSLDCLVFVQNRGTIRPVFIATAEPKLVRWCLGRAYPMLETALAHAYAALFPKPPQLPFGSVLHSSRGALETNQAAQLLREFLQLIQQAIPPLDPRDWTALGTPPFWEYAQWLDAQRLNTDLEEILSISSFEDTPDLPNSQRVESILRRTGSFVALVDKTGHFDGLIDRRLLLENAAASALQRKSSERAT